MLVQGGPQLGGMRQRGATLAFAPRLPEGITRLAFNLEFRGRRLRVEATPTTTRYELLHGKELEIFHLDQPVTVSAN